MPSSFCLSNRVLGGEATNTSIPICTFEVYGLTKLPRVRFRHTIEAVCIFNNFMRNLKTNIK